jgi:O-antigen ligase
MAELGHFLVQHAWIWATLLGLVYSAVLGRLALRGSDWAPMLVIATVPIQRDILIGRGSAHLTWTQAALAAFFAGALLRYAGGTLRVRLDAPAITFGLVVSVYGLSVAVANDMRLWAAESYRWAVAAAFMIIARSYFSSESARRLCCVLVVGAVATGVWAGIQVAVAEGPASFERSGLMRAYGGFGEPNPFAACVWAITLPIVAFVAFAGWASTRVRVGAGAGAAIGVAALALTQSRGGFLGAAAGAGLIGLVALLRARPRVRLGGLVAGSAVIAVVALFVVHLAPWSEIGAVTTPVNWADQERTAHWAAAVAMVEGNPVLGVGAGQFSEHYRDATRFWRFRISRGHAHNAYLQVAAEVGLAGLLAYASLLCAVLGSLIGRLKASRTDWLAVGVAAMTVALLVHQLVDYLHVLSLGLLFAGLWAAALPTSIKGESSRELNIPA